MKTKIFLIVIILIGFSSTLFSQTTFRRAIFLHRSVGGNIYGPNNSNTSVPEECESYNVAHNYAGADAVSMDEIFFPWNGGSGNAWWCWRDVFDDVDPDDDIYQYIDAYDIIIIKTCYTVGIPVYWYYGTNDTLDVTTQSYYNYQWHCRYIVHKMGTMPDKFFVIWTPAMYTPANAPTPTGYPLGDAFAYWMKDTLAAGIDAIYNSRYGAFPENVHIYDYFHDIDSSTYLPVSLAASPTDNHPNAAGTELIAPLFVKDVFDAAIAYEATIPVELISFSVSIVSAGVELHWVTATELNNDGFEIQRKTYNGEFISVGFLKGQGTSTQKKDYIFIDKNTTSGRYKYRLKQVDFNGNYKYSSELEVDFNDINTYSLEQNYPNPFNPSTEIIFTLANSGNVTLKVYDSLGSEVATIVDGYLKAGKHSVNFNAKNFTSGVYYYRIKADNFTSTRKMLLIK